MERLVLTFLLGVFFLAAADAIVSSIRTISGGESTTFSLPESKTFVLAMKSAEAPKIKYQYHAQGRLIADDKCDDCYQGSLWVPFLTITEEGIKRYDSGTNWFPENIGSSQPRNLSIQSKGSSTVDLQVFTLPLKEHELVAMPLGGSVNISLPEKEEIWLALWNKQETAVLVTFNLYYETEPTHETFPANLDKGWFIIRIFKYKIVYGGNLHNLMKHGLKGRRLELNNPSSLKYQLFTMPLDPKDPKEETDTNESVDTDGTLYLDVCCSVFSSSSPCRNLPWLQVLLEEEERRIK
ncbi:uncharacterized protein [Macrobrachium rosenbergii]|uniref:uncharacterized protein isoform X2 n=1 Tax=Macrobrachium rosenbergii TaxID=79674 RepID=UPI0034D49635